MAVSAPVPTTVKFNAKIFVTLHPAVLDPAGTAVRDALNQLASENPPETKDAPIQTPIQTLEARIGKYIELTLEAPDATAATAHATQACDQLLANPVIETYRVEVTAA
ncbi:MAG: phosphoribosylformylglycinamidine synthase subunit PurS [Oscillatoriales cyanobacterium SM2_1_8]|nr:phosphoribosylformylglycinamidine synthase subunit PurS [Oscillatoriales cyanobacterium SM2_1_8]